MGALRGVAGREQQREALTVRRQSVGLAATIWGSAARTAPAALFVHGLGGTSRSFDGLARRLSPELRVVAYDQRGHGRSSKPSSGYGFGSLASDAVAVADSTGLKRPIIVGSSWGANVALEAAVRFPRRFRGLVLLDGGFVPLRELMDWPTAKGHADSHYEGALTIERYLAEWRELLRPMEIDPDMEEVLLSSMRTRPDGSIRERLSRRNRMAVLRALWGQDQLDLLRQVRIPTRVLAGSAAAPDEEEWLDAKHRCAPSVRAIGDPVRFAWIPCTHYVELQRPDAIALLIRDLIT
jgi:pimeloyl-ACP methyl ester carboxylesterase